MFCPDVVRVLAHWNIIDVKTCSSTFKGSLAGRVGWRMEGLRCGV
jgi:hypothetical protein